MGKLMAYGPGNGNGCSNTIRGRCRRDVVSVSFPECMLLM
jgi:hypothetical protein